MIEETVPLRCKGSFNQTKTMIVKKEIDEDSKTRKQTKRR